MNWAITITPSVSQRRRSSAATAESGTTSADDPPTGAEADEPVTGVQLELHGWRWARLMNNVFRENSFTSSSSFDLKGIVR
jgi:hypothetical protein